MIYLKKYRYYSRKGELDIYRSFLKCIISFLVITCLSCSSSSNEGVNISSVTFEKLDSIQIEYLGNPLVHDIDPKSGTILFMEHGAYQEEIHVADFEGTINHSFTKFGDLPDTYGILFSPLMITGENSFVAYCIKGLITYDLSGNFVSRTVIEGIQPYNFRRTSMGFGLGISEAGYIYIDQGSRKADYSDLNLYREVSPIICINPLNGEQTSIIKIPESSIYLNGKHFFRDAWAPVFEVTKEHLYVAFGVEPVIYTYENKPLFTLLAETAIDLPNYHYFKGQNNSNVDFMWVMISGRIDNIKKVDGYFIIGYFPGYDVIDSAENFENKSPNEARDFGERMRKKYRHRIAVVDSLGNLVSDFEPEGLDPMNMIIRDGQLWMTESYDPDVEKEYFRIYKVGLKVD